MVPVKALHVSNSKIILAPELEERAVAEDVLEYQQQSWREVR